jgi:hypothetical protein
MRRALCLGLVLSLFACSRTEPLEPPAAGVVAPEHPSLALNVAPGSVLRDDGTPLTLVVSAAAAPGRPGTGTVVLTASGGQFAASGQAMVLLTLQGGLALATYACDGRAAACGVQAVAFEATWVGLSADLAVTVTHVTVVDAGPSDAGPADAGLTDAGPGTLSLQVASGTQLTDDGQPITLLVTATRGGAPGQGTVRLGAEKGRFVASGQSTVDLTLSQGGALVTFACDIHLDPTCTPPAVTFSAEWGGVATALDVPLVHVDTVGTCDSTCQQIAPSLSGLQWDLPCGAPATSFSCFLSPAPPLTSTLVGTPGATYDVVLRFRGVVEQRGYVGGSNDGAFWQIGGAPGPDQYNTIQFAISDPPQTYYVNRGASLLQYCFLIDYMKTVRVAAGATLTLSFQDTDRQEIDNIDAAGNPISVPGLPGQPYNGQFVQIDVVSATRAN